MRRAALASVALLLQGLLQLSDHAFGQSARLIKLPLTRATTEEAGIYGQPVLNYYTSVDIGTPPKPFNVQFDVNLSDSFVPHYTWNIFKGNLHYGKGFQCKVSSSCKKIDKQFMIEYQHCSLTGKPYEDLLVFKQAATANQTLQNLAHLALRQSFLAVSDASDGRFKDLPVDGFVGLSPAAQSPAGVANLLVNLKRANLIDNLQFSFWFNPILDSTQGGELTLGGVDTRRYQGSIFWHKPNIVALQSWSLALQYVSIGSQVISCSGMSCQAVLSTGLNEMFGPREDVDKIYRILGSTKSDGLQLVDCRRIAQLPMLAFTIDGIPYNLLPSNYIRRTSNGKIFKKETCYVAILPSLDNNQREWVLGTNFFGAYYTVFDITYGQVGFAALS